MGAAIVKRAAPRLCPPTTGACQPWTGKTRHGYGLDHGRPAHVVAWEREVGPIPDGYVVDHECHNADGDCRGGKTCPHRACQNVDHLTLRTIGENARRGFRTRTTCQRGHLWTDENTLWRKEGRRNCRRCAEARKRREGNSDEYRRKARERMRRVYARRRALS
jgi:hypothetical protein